MSGRVGLLLLGLCLVQAGMSLGWMHQYGFLARPPQIEQAFYRLDTMQLLGAYQDEGWAGLARQAWQRADPRTLLLPIVASLIAAGGDDGVTRVEMWATMALFGALQVLGTYRLARNFGGQGLALAAASVTTCAPIVVVYQRPFYPQLPMAALLPWALDALVRSRAFARLLPACVFALLAVAATLLKVIAPVYLAGSVLMALVAGLRDAGRRRAVLRNFVAVTGLALLVMMPRILQTFPRLLAYTHTATDESFYAVRAMSSRWTADRWLYYPLNFVNNGLGLPLAALTLAALIRWAAARSAQAGASQRKEAACILAGGVVLSYPVLTYGQTGGNSQYLLSWVPLSALFLVASVSALEPLRVRRLAVALTAIASLWGLLLAMRPPSLDSTLLAVGPLQVVARSDWYIGKLARNYHIVERPEAEPWPIGEFTDMILDREQGREVRVASSNPILCAPNLEHEALLRGGRLVSAQVPWLQIRGGDLDPSFLARIDYLIIDTPMFEAEPASAFLRYIGYDCEVLAVREVSAFTSVALLALSRPWDRPERVTARALDAQGIRRHTVRFGSGPRLLASEVLRPVALRGRVTVHTYWTGFVDSEPVDLEVRLVDSANRTLWQSETLVLEAAGRGGTGDILCMTATSSPLGSDIVVAGCALSLRAHGAGRRVAVTHPDGLPVTSDGELLIPQP